MVRVIYICMKQFWTWTGHYGTCFTFLYSKHMIFDTSKKSIFNDLNNKHLNNVKKIYDYHTYLLQGVG